MAIFAETSVLGNMPVLATIGNLTIVQDGKCVMVVYRGVTVLAVCDRLSNAIAYAKGVKQ